MAHFTRRAALLGGGALAGGWAAVRYGPRSPVLDGTASLIPDAAPGTLNDASGLSETPVFRHLVISDDPGEALIAALRNEIAEARSLGRPFNIGAARHSMGGQAIPRDGHAVTFDNGLVEPDTANGIMRAHAGARWAQVIATLDPLGYGPKVMQSNNDFGVAATFCVNAHGWPVPFGPMGGTVRSVQMLLPGGDLIEVNRGDDLFNMTMGGYGLTGAIIAMDVEVEKNARLVPTFAEMDAEDFAQRFVVAANSGDISMAYGRLNVDRANFFDRALMITYRADADQSDLPAVSGSGLASKIAARIYRVQLHNERAKRLRWWTETDVGPALGSGPVTRNSLINEPVVTLDDRNPNRTDILHEYFVAPARFGEFLEVCRAIIPASYQEFLNVTLRYVAADPESVLAYATVARIAAVMSFSQEMTVRAEADMARMTRALIDGIIGIGGAYYLPYRPHATPAQLARAYPRAGEFAAAKRALDPTLTFRNNLWDSYLVAL